MNPRDRGFTLLELLLAMSLGLVMIAGLLLVVQSLSLSLRQQQALGEMQANGRFALDTLATAIEGASSTEQPWGTTEAVAVEHSVAGASEGSDRLVVQQASPRNCVGNDNPVRRPDGQPAFWLLRREFELRTPRRLVLTCYYGPGPGPGIRQLNAATLVEGIEALRLTFGEDRDRDGRVDAWVGPGAWADEAQVLGARIGLVATSAQTVGAGAMGTISLPGGPFTAADDGRPRLALVRTVPIQSRQR